MTTTKDDQSRRVRKPVNYAEYFRRTRRFHEFTFQLPRKGATKANLAHVRKLKSIQNMYASGQFTAEEIEKVIRRKAIDRAINEELSSQQKSAITRQWHGTKHKPGLEHIWKQVRDNQTQFVNVKNANRKKKLRNMRTTNKGVFIYEENVKARVRGKGKNLDIVIDRKPAVDVKVKEPIFYRYEVFVPFDEDVIIPDAVAEQFDSYEVPPDAMAIGVMSAPGVRDYKNISGLDYIADAISEYEAKGQQHPFSGVFFYWY